MSPCSAHDIGFLAHVAELLIAAQTEPLTSAVPSQQPPTVGHDEPMPNRAPVAEQILEAVCTQLTTSTAKEPRHPAPRRYVNLARLSRMDGVSERVLYDRWPTVTSLNGELIAAVVRREQAMIQEVWWNASATAISNGTELGLDVAVATIRRGTLVPVDLSPHRLAMYALACFDPEVGQHLANVIDPRDETELPQALAFVTLLGRRQRPDTSLSKFYRMTIDFGLGLQRIVALRPEVRDVETHVDGTARPVVGWLTLAFIRALTLPA